MADPKKPARRAPKPATPDRLTAAAEAYVARFQATEAMLRDVLMRRVRRTERLHGLDADAHTALIAAVDDICARYVRVGLVDDAAYAAQRARVLFERGTAPGRIRRRLALKGVDPETADAALAALEDAEADSAGADMERAACIRLARRRRLGPFNVRGDREARREKDLAALARAGFGFDVARAVIEADSPDDLDP
jgi:regulatory protein